METLQMFQQFGPAATAFAVLALPWAALAAMHAFSALTSDSLDDTWRNRAGAALRWAGTVAALAPKVACAQVQYAQAA
jgi:hypothetical protein